MINDNILVAKLSSLLEDEDPLVNELILETLQEVEMRQISVEAHVKKAERMLDRKLANLGDDGK